MLCTMLAVGAPPSRATGLQYQTAHGLRVYLDPKGQNKVGKGCNAGF